MLRSGIILGMVDLYAVAGERFNTNMIKSKISIVPIIVRLAEINV